jgi:hypothetical protein
MRLILAIICFFINTVLYCQGAANYAVLLSAEVQNSPPQIKLNWRFQAGVSNYQVFRKLKSASNWGTPIASLGVNDTTYIDVNPTTGVSYEYRVDKNAGSYFAYGFINSGIEIPVSTAQKRVILLVDSLMRDSLKTELTQWTANAEAEGWNVARIDMPRDINAVEVSGSYRSKDVKDRIIIEYQKDPENTKALFIVGHVAVPYSGFFKPTPPDPHTEHIVAWPADVYYGDIGWHVD